MSRSVTRATRAVLRGLLIIWPVLAGCMLAVSAVLAHQGVAAPFTPFIAAILVGAFAVGVVLVHHAYDMRVERRQARRGLRGD